MPLQGGVTGSVMFFQNLLLHSVISRRRLRKQEGSGIHKTVNPEKVHSFLRKSIM